MSQKDIENAYLLGRRQAREDNRNKRSPENPFRDRSRVSAWSRGWNDQVNDKPNPYDDNEEELFASRGE